MRKIGSILFVLLLLVAQFPNVSLAAQDPNFDQELNKYIDEVSKVRGVDVTKEDIDLELLFYDTDITSISSVDEIRSLLGDPIKADLSNLDTIYETYDLDKESLNQLLGEYGEGINDYLFLNVLEESVVFYIDELTFERDPNFEQELEIYLAELTKIRGREVTKEDIDNSLALYDFTLDEFESVTDLRDFYFYDEPIKADLSNLDYFMAYDLDQDALLQLLEENGDSIDNYIFIADLDQSVMTYTGEWPLELDDEMFMELLQLFQDEFDLTDDELQRLDEHFMSIEEYLSQHETLERLENLAFQMMDFAEFEQATELTDDQISELVSIYNEFLNIFQLKASYSLVKNGLETPLSITELFAIEELKDANLKITLYNLTGELLADMIVTGEMVDSDTINHIGEKMTETTDTVSTTKKPEAKTVKGAKLPQTASDYGMNAITGLGIMLLGILLFRKLRKA